MDVVSIYLANSATESIALKSVKKRISCLTPGGIDANLLDQIGRKVYLFPALAAERNFIALREVAQISIAAKNVIIEADGERVALSDTSV